MKFRSWVVLLIILLNILFAAAVLLVFEDTGAEPSVLVGGWFAFTTGELWALAVIKRGDQDGNKNGEPHEAASDSEE